MQHCPPSDALHGRVNLALRDGYPAAAQNLDGFTDLRASLLDELGPLIRRQFVILGAEN
jgi:hypothetical protein